MFRAHAWSRPRRLLARFKRERGGAAAVEFAILALPFLALLFAVFELGMIYLISTSLSNATTNEARKIRTCQLQGQTTQAQFVNDVCGDNAMSWLGANCSASTLMVDVNTYTSFANTNNPQNNPANSPLVNGQFSPTNLAFNMGNAGDIILVRTYYPWSLVTPGLDGLVSQIGNGQFLIEAASTFRNEPCT